MGEAINHFHDAAQSFSEAKQILESALAQGRGMNAEELQRYNKHFNAACDSREAMKKQQAEEMAARIATIEGELADSINGGGESLSESARRGTRMYHEQFNAESVPYRWHTQGPISNRRAGVSLESVVPNPALKDEWSFLERRSARKYQESMEAYLARPFETRATQQMDLDELGGFWLMPVQMMNDILKIADNMVYVRQLARVTPRVDATSLAGRFLEEDVEDADWSGEITPIELTQIKMGLRRLRPKNLNKGVAFSFDIIMQEPSISAFVVERLGYKRGITEERGYLLGNGVNEALGAMTPSDQGIPTSRDVDKGNTATEVSLVGIQSAKWSIRTAYWDDLTWFGARNFWLQVSLLRRTDGQPIWHTSIDMRHPDTLLGDPAYISEYMPNVLTSGKYAGIVGNWKEGYHIADAYDMTMQRVDQQFATQNVIVFIMRSKSDGMPIRPDAFARVKMGT